MNDREFLIDSNEHGDIGIELKILECHDVNAKQGAEFVTSLKYKGESFRQWGRWQMSDALEIYDALNSVLALLARPINEE